MPISKKFSLEESEELTRKFFEAVGYFGLVGREVSLLLGVSEATISRAKLNPYYFRRSQPHLWTIAQLVTRLHRAVTMRFIRQRKGKLWLIYFDPKLRSSPLDLIFTFEGLIEVVKYAEDLARLAKLSRFERRLAQLGEANV